MAKRNKKFDFVKMFLKRNNVTAKHYVTEEGERLPARPLMGNIPRLVATSNKNDRAFLGENVISTTENA